MSIINIPELRDIDLEPFWIEECDVKLALKYYTLFSKVNDEVVIVTNLEHLSEALSFIPKYNLPYKFYLIDDNLFERLYHKFLEIKTDSEIGSLTQDSVESEDEFELSDFLKVSQDLLTTEDAAPIIKLVNALFYQAIKKRASDIHIEPHDKKGEIRYRVDGALVKHMDIEKNIFSLVVSRIKVISNLDISERRIPQDGRTAIKIAGKNLDVRVSILPTYYGERVVMRILMQSDDIPQLPQLGFSEELNDRFKELLKHSHGMILVTGPTGSGKSTTLHSFLQNISTPDKNIITVEDPVEYNAHNINQVQTHEKIGLSFSAALRSILRQDPDVIMVGEIRDKETAKIAVQAALTGHLMLSTLHTNTATGAVTRLVDMGVEEYLIASSLLGALAQRLVRKLCPHCKEENFDAEDFLEEFELPLNSVIYKAKGCNKCSFTGYMGRKAIGELFLIDNDVKTVLKHTTNDHEIRDFMIKNKDFKTLKHQLKDMIVSGDTSIEEAIRVGLKDE